MPFVSQAQRAKFYSDPRLRKLAAEWEKGTPAHLPKHVPKKKGSHMAIPPAFQKRLDAMKGASEEKGEGKADTPSEEKGEPAHKGKPVAKKKGGKKKFPPKQLNAAMAKQMKGKKKPLPPWLQKKGA